MRRYLSEFVYGATDGAVTTFAIIAGTIGAGLNPIIVVLLGVSNLLADGFSMAASNYLSKRTENALLLEGQIPVRPFRGALATFSAFVLIGSIPLIPFVVARFIPIFSLYQFEVAILATSVAFLFIGAVRGRVTKRNPYFVAFETLLVGGIAAMIAYGVGMLIRTLVG